MDSEHKPPAKYHNWNITGEAQLSPINLQAALHSLKEGPIGASKWRNPVTALCRTDCIGLPYIGNIAMLQVDGL